MTRKPGRSWRNVDELLDEWAQLTSHAAPPAARRTPVRSGNVALGALQAAGVLAVVAVVVGVFWLRPDDLLGPASSPAASTPQAPPSAPADSVSPSPTPTSDETPSPSPQSTAPRTPMFPPSSPTPPVLAGEWRMLPPSPIEDGSFAKGVWTGHEFLVWGTAGLTDGAAYNPATDNWRRLPDGPRGPGESMVAFWTGDVVIAWHGGRPGAPNEPDGGIYDPATNSWTPVSPGPLDSHYGQGVAWTSSELLVLARDMRAAAYDPTIDTWRNLPSPSLPPGGVEADWTGTEWLVLGFGTEQGAAARVAAFDPESGTWNQLADSPMTEQNLGREATWIYDRWLWFGLEGFVYDRGADQWRTIDTRCPVSSSTSVWTGGLVLGSRGAFDPQTGFCTVIPPAPYDVLVSEDQAIAWTGMELLLWGGSSGTGDTTTTDGARFIPSD